MVIELGIFSHTGICGADWKPLQIHFQGESFYNEKDRAHSTGNVLEVWLKTVHLKRPKEEGVLDRSNHTSGFWKKKEVALQNTARNNGVG